MLDFFDRMPFPHPSHFRVGTDKMRRIGEEFVRHHGGIVFQRHGRGKVQDDRAVLRQRQHLLNPLVDRFDVVPEAFGQPIERNMFARVVDFLLNESPDLLGQLLIGTIPMGFDRFDEVGFAPGESRR